MRVRRKRRVTRRGRMMVSNASQRTTRNSAAPRANAAGKGIMIGRKSYHFRRWTRCRGSRLEPRRDGDRGLEKFRHRAARFGSLDCGVEFRPVRSGDARSQVEVAFRDGEAVGKLFKGNRHRGFELLRRESGIAELRGERHGKTPGVSRGEQLFGIRADAVFKTRAEGILRLLEHPALGGERSLAVLQAAVTDGRCFALHAILSCQIVRWILIRRIGFPTREQGYILLESPSPRRPNFMTGQQSVHSATI